MKLPEPFTDQHMLDDFTHGTRIYFAMLKTGRPTIRIFIHTRRPMMWYLASDSSGHLHPELWIVTSIKTIRDITYRLLNAGLELDSNVRLRLELLHAYTMCEIDERAEIAEQILKVQETALAESRRLPRSTPPPRRRTSQPVSASDAKP